MTLGPTYPSSFFYVVPGESVTVTDAQPPLPNSKEQCKNGGWQQFGFKNQGRCIAFVNHQARRACLAERSTIGLPAFRAKYGKGRQHRDALSRCIRRTGG